MDAQNPSPVTIPAEYEQQIEVAEDLFQRHQYVHAIEILLGIQFSAEQKNTDDYGHYCCIAMPFRRGLSARGNKEGACVYRLMLSCCQTALGTPHPDSTIGLTNAMLIAGACTVGSTLWKIPDDATSVLITRFYQELKSGADVDKAMSIAQKCVRLHSGWAHPFSWGAFKITGSHSNPLLSLIRKGGRYAQNCLRAFSRHRSVLSSGTQFAWMCE